MSTLDAVQENDAVPEAEVELPAGYEEPEFYDAGEQFRPTIADLPDERLTDAQWLRGAGKSSIAEDDPRRFGPPDGLSITERLRQRAARLNAWKCVYHLSPGHPNRFQLKSSKRRTLEKPPMTDSPTIPALETSTPTDTRPETPIAPTGAPGAPMTAPRLCTICKSETEPGTAVCAPCHAKIVATLPPLTAGQKAARTRALRSAGGMPPSTSTSVDRPADWATMGPGQKAAWTRRSRMQLLQGGASTTPEKPRLDVDRVRVRVTVHGKLDGAQATDLLETIGNAIGLALRTKTLSHSLVDVGATLVDGEFEVDSEWRQPEPVAPVLTQEQCDEATTRAFAMFGREVPPPFTAVG